MSSDGDSVSVAILDKDYRVSCQRDETEALRRSAQYLDQRMREIRASGKVIGSERIAVMAALNIAHELLQGEAGSRTLNNAVGTRIRSLRERVETALTDTNQLEL
ncbi:MAG: cell division protein ZapA [Chromatiales bacterium]|nr:cell division protein ZapA [Chromatiales bacterium]